MQMDMPKEAERLMKLYKSLSKEEFQERLKTDEQVMADVKVTVKWLEVELQPFIDICVEVAKELVKNLEPLTTYINDKQAMVDAINKKASIANGISIGI